VLLHEPPRSLNFVQGDGIEACLLDFGRELLRAVEVCGGKPLRVANRVGVPVLATRPSRESSGRQLPEP
jgi:hypothetical protein